MANRSVISAILVDFRYGSCKAEGDSGEELGDMSAIDVVSKVELVVVGEESVDSDVLLVEEIISWWSKGTECPGAEFNEGIKNERSSKRWGEMVDFEAHFIESLPKSGAKVDEEA